MYRFSDETVTRRSFYRSSRNTSPCVFPRVAWIRQQPFSQKNQPVPHSPPGWTQFDPVWRVGPHTGFTRVPLGAVAKIRRGPVPVIRQIHFSGYGCDTSPSKTAVGGPAEGPKPKTHICPLLVVPLISGQPVGTYELTV